MSLTCMEEDEEERRCDVESLTQINPKHDV